MSAKRKRYFGRVLDPQAGVVLLSDYVNLPFLSKEIRGSLTRGIHIICGICWSIESPKHVLKVIFIVLRNRILFPKIRISMLANTPNELRLLQVLRLFGVRSVYCNHNCFVDASIMTIRSGADKKYDAVYNGVLSGYKRQILAKDVPKLALVTYRFENTSYKEYLDRELAEPIWLNWTSGDDASFLDNEQVAGIYNASRTGLALSAIEGPMFASCEYLLCGIPVVSTRSKGGRDIFFTSYNSVVVEDDPEAVAAAVRDLKAAKKDPQRIRDEAVQVMNVHWKVFIDHINSVLRARGWDHDISDTRDKWYFSKMRGDLYADELIEALNASSDLKPSY